MNNNMFCLYGHGLFPVQSFDSPDELELCLFSSQLLELMGRGNIEIVGPVARNLLARAVHHGHLHFRRHETVRSHVVPHHSWRNECVR